MSGFRPNSQCSTPSDWMANIDATVKLAQGLTLSSIVSHRASRRPGTSNSMKSQDPEWVMLKILQPAISEIVTMTLVIPLLFDANRLLYFQLFLRIIFI